MKLLKLTLAGILAGIVLGSAVNQSVALYKPETPAVKSAPSEPQYGDKIDHVYSIDGNNLYIDFDVVDPDFYTGLLMKIDSCKEPTTLYITTRGGSLTAAYAISDAVARAPCDITVRVRGMALSAGALISAAAPKMTMAPGSILMFHMYHRGQGKLPASEAFTPMGREFRATLEKYASDILLPEEIDLIMQGHDVWLTKEDYDKRTGNK